MLTYDGRHDHDAVAEVRAAPDGRPARDHPPRTAGEVAWRDAARSRNVSGPAAMSTRVRSAKQCEDRAPSPRGRTRQPSGSVGSGSPPGPGPPRGRRGSARPRRDRTGERGHATDLGRDATPPPRGSDTNRPPPSTSARSRSRVTSGAAARRLQAAAAVPAACRWSSTPIARSAAFTGTGLGAPRKFARISGSHRSWIAVLRRIARRAQPRRARPSRPGSRSRPRRRRRRRPSPGPRASRRRRRRAPRHRAAGRGRSRAICSRLPLASLTATTRGCSASRRNVSASTFVPVRAGTL